MGTGWRNGNDCGASVNQLALVTTRDNGDLLGEGLGWPMLGVVTLEAHPDEEDAFGPAAPLVAEWRELRTGSKASGGRVERAQVAVRRWGLEIAMLRDFHLTLPPETEPLDASRREDHLRWREDALTEARRELARAKRMRLLRRVLTLGLWWP